MTHFHQENQQVKYQYNADTIIVASVEEDDASIDLTVRVMPDPASKHDGAFDHVPQERRLTYLSRNVAGDVVISPQMPYLASLTSGGPIAGTYDAANLWFAWGFPNLDVMVVNNTKRVVLIQEAIFKVARSTPNLSPIPLFEENPWRVLQTRILNEGWGAMRRVELEFNLSNPGTTPDYASPYRFKIALGDFDDSAEVDLTEPLRASGVNVDLLRALEMPSFDRPWNNREVVEACGPFAQQWAQAYGVLHYSWQTEEGVEETADVRFSVRVPLVMPGPAMPLPPSFQYSVELRVEGSDYEVIANLAQQIAPREADRFNISVGAEQSSRHRFVLGLKLSNGVELTSPPVELGMFVPRTRFRGFPSP